MKAYLLLVFVIRRVGGVRRVRVGGSSSLLDNLGDFSNLLLSVGDNSGGGVLDLLGDGLHESKVIVSSAERKRIEN